ncbi:MAG TPA: DNA alkylation repair protein [Candidatus Syntrophosphaera sp.]|jgi:3-methyladenine DNA glycosylase AlkD|nr:DNA alkylation repair protein [Candidatus Cloacimonadota bacterium]HOR03284.1 DNA alkylation repair protein [Candidatus Syntrophosphaera sp.]HOU72039.1 DNA alkylation repair protein [Candidatus Syntrophosphaera sp.]HPB42875.1 DNA alkylation repair protein [Candidatus Syntrophosphaera sp.]HPK83133.1 DNA alkylation repair protein [Candidatus Syntrophosphaera sp.]
MTLLTARTELDPRQQEIFKFCEAYFFAHENPALVNKNARYFTEGYDAFGIKEDELRELRDQLLERFEPSVPELAELAYHLFATGKYEFGSLALMLLKKHRPRFDRSVFDQLKRTLDDVVENWAHADVIGTKLTPVLLELNLVDLADFEPWRFSPSKWTRRVAAVTLLYLRSHRPVEQLLEFIQPLMQDNTRPVQQGVGWFLRELWKVHSREVEDFLFANKDTAPRLVIQYATEKMNKDKKKRFRRAISKAVKPNKHQSRKDKPPQEDSGE